MTGRDGGADLRPIGNAHLPRSADSFAGVATTVNARHRVALARHVRVGRRSPSTRRDRAALDRRLKERLSDRVAHVAGIATSALRTGKDQA